MSFLKASSSISASILARTTAAAVAACVATSLASAQDGADRVAADVAKVSEAYLIGPAAAGQLGCRVSWQALIPVPTSHGLTQVSASPMGVLALNSRNEVSLVRPENGNRAWTASAAQSSDRVLALEIVEVTGRDGNPTNRIMVTTDTVIYGIDIENGATVLRSRPRLPANTTPLVVGSSLVFGTRLGQVSWFGASHGTEYRAYTVDGPTGKSPITAAPALGSGVVVAGSSIGTVAGLDAGSGMSMWRRELLGGVSASPVIAGSQVFVASEDQYLYAFDLESGSTMWKYFTQSPLTRAPFAAGNIVVQDIPGEGWVAFAQSTANPGGEVLWKQTGLDGRPIGTVDGALLYWCNQHRVATLVDMKKGDVVRKIELPAVKRLMADDLEDGGLVAWSDDGRIERLSPVAKPAVATQPAADAASNG
jgi:outer membrane protein assembly factor BamB